MAVQNETDKRISLLNALMNTPHRRLDLLQPVHEKIAREDPLFYRQLAAWYADNGSVRDHTELFAANLSIIPVDKNNPEFSRQNRDVGLALLRNLPPYAVERVINFVNGVKEYPLREKKEKNVRDKKTGRMKLVSSTEVKKIKFGLFKNVPKSLRTEVKRYLREREADNDWFDATVLTAKKTLKHLYKLFKLTPGNSRDSRANKILFKGEMPEGSRLEAIQKVARSKDPAEQAKLIIDNKISYRVASSVVTNMTPSVLLALMTVMTDQEFLNNAGSLEKRGVKDNPDLKKVFDERIERAKKSKKVSVLKSATAVKDTNLSEETKTQLADVASAQVKRGIRLNRNTALFVDKSSSMDVAIDIGKQLAATIAPAVGDNYQLHVYAFDSMPYEIKSTGKDLQSWTKAFAGIVAGGATSCGAPIALMVRDNVIVDQIVIITDECEWPSGTFVRMYKDYVNRMGVTPSVRIIRCGDSRDVFYSQLLKEGYDVEYVEFTGDFNGIPNLLLFLNKSSRLDLLMDIMSYELPKRKDH